MWLWCNLKGYIAGALPARMDSAENKGLNSLQRALCDEANTDTVQELSTETQMIYSPISIRVPSTQHMYCTAFDKNPV